MDSVVTLTPTQINKLLEQVRVAILSRRYSIRTEQTYLQWIRQFLRMNGNRPPICCGKAEVTRFLSHLAGERRLAPSTQNQALYSILFLYRNVLKQPYEWLEDLDRARQPVRIPTVFSKAEANAILQQLEGSKWLMAGLLYGSGLRLMECLYLRVKDILFPQQQIAVRDAQGRQDRISLLPKLLIHPLRRHLNKVKMLHDQDLQDGFGAVDSPHAPQDHRSALTKAWIWQYVFPSSKRSYDRRFQTFRRLHAHEAVLQRAVKEAIRAAGITKPGSCQTLRHSFAVHMLESGCDIRTVQELLGHKDVNTTMIYTRIFNQSKQKVRSPIDDLDWIVDGDQRFQR